MTESRAERSRALWRRQAVLTGLVAVAFAVVAPLVVRVSEVSNDAAARQRLSLPVNDHVGLVVALGSACVVLAALLGALCLQTYRIVALTFSPYEESH